MKPGSTSIKEATRRGRPDIFIPTSFELARMNGETNMMDQAQKFGGSEYVRTVLLHQSLSMIYGFVRRMIFNVDVGQGSSLLLWRGSVSSSKNRDISTMKGFSDRRHNCS